VTTRSRQYYRYGSVEVTPVISRPEVEKKFIEMGYVTTGSTPEEYLAKLKFETERWTKVVKDNGIKVES
jgi:tripartite-type tricarboxylate transporter receptor subunit TctC